MTSVVETIESLVAADRAFAHVIVVGGPDLGASAVIADGEVVAGAVGIDLDELAQDVAVLVARGQSATLSYGPHDVFVDAITPRPDLVVFGAFHVAEVLSALAARVGFRVVVADPRPAFAEADRFPDADEVRTGWPDELVPELGIGANSYVVSLLHDDRHEAALLPAVLATAAPYIGALGSRKTHARRVANLREQGVADEEIERISGPVGLDIGAATPEEVALAILAEAVAVRRGGGAADLIGRVKRIGEAAG